MINDFSICVFAITFFFLRSASRRFDEWKYERTGYVKMIANIWIKYTITAAAQIKSHKNVEMSRNGTIKLVNCSHLWMHRCARWRLNLAFWGQDLNQIACIYFPYHKHESDYIVKLIGWRPPTTQYIHTYICDVILVLNVISMLFFSRHSLKACFYQWNTSSPLTPLVNFSSRASLHLFSFLLRFGCSNWSIGIDSCGFILVKSN